MGLAAGLPLIPFIHSGQDVIFFLLVMIRVTAFLLVVPIFASRNFSKLSKMGFTLFVTTLLVVSLYPSYLGEHSQYSIEGLHFAKRFSLLPIILTGIKEFLVGYLIGFIYTFIFEAILVGGQIAGTMAGFGIMSMIDPMSDTSRPLLAQLFNLTITLLILSLDFHHLFFRQIVQSFKMVPIGNYHMPFDLLQSLGQGSGRIFVYAIQCIAFPFLILFLVTMLLGLMAKVMPTMNVFIIGFPLKILVGVFSLVISIGFFPQILQMSIYEFQNLIQVVLRYIGG